MTDHLDQSNCVWWSIIKPQWITNTSILSKWYLWCKDQCNWNQIVAQVMYMYFDDQTVLQSNEDEEEDDDDDDDDDDDVQVTIGEINTSAAPYG